jgi:hypothetical protein
LARLPKFLFVEIIEDSQRQNLVVIAIMVVIIPIALGVPAPLMFIPPAMVGAPAALTGCAEIVTGALGLPTLIAMMSNGLVEFVIGVDNAALAIMLIG